MLEVATKQAEGGQFESNMPQIIVINSFKSSGKTTIAASLAVLMANQGRRIGIIDLDIAHPGLNLLFGLTVEKQTYALNDYLWGRCGIEQAAYDVSASFTNQKGRLYVIPSSAKAGDVARVARWGYDVGLLNDGLHRLVEILDLDLLLVDTHSALSEETLLMVAISDISLVVTRLDQQHYQGTGVMIEVAKKLDIPQALIMVNMCPSIFDTAEVKSNLETVFKCKVPVILPFSPEIQLMASGLIFACKYPIHPITQTLERFATDLAGGKGISKLAM